jgi:hypothetical protein
VASSSPSIDVKNFNGHKPTQRHPGKHSVQDVGYLSHPAYWMERRPDARRSRVSPIKTAALASLQQGFPSGENHPGV